MRLHPLTWCVATATMGVLIGVNQLCCSFDGTRLVYGWPLTHEWVSQHFQHGGLHSRFATDGEDDLDAIRASVTATPDRFIEESEWSYPALAANSVLALLMTVCILILCECLLRGLRHVGAGRYEWSLHSLTWFVIALVLGGLIGLNRPRGDVRDELTLGWPLTYKRVFPTPFAFGNESIRADGSPIRTYTVELTTLISYSALLTDLLIVILAAATVGSLTERALRRVVPTPELATRNDELTVENR